MIGSKSRLFCHGLSVLSIIEYDALLSNPTIHQYSSLNCLFPKSRVYGPARKERLLLTLSSLNRGLAKSNPPRLICFSPIR